MASDLLNVAQGQRTVRLITIEQHDLWGTGRYFATMVTAKRDPCLSTVVSGGFARWTTIGRKVQATFEHLCQNYPLAIDKMVIMPDHLHICFRVTTALPKNILEILNTWRCQVQEMLGFSDAKPFWETPYHLFTAFNREVYTRCIDYTAANPRRWWQTRNHGAEFTPQIVTHALLDNTYTWQAVGHMSLLDAPVMMSVRIHRADTAETISSLTTRAIQIAEAGGVIIGGFVSPAEKELLKQLYAAVPDVRLISLMPHTLTDYKPPARALTAFCQGHRLLLTTEPNHPTNVPCTREVCLRHNDLAEQIAQKTRGM